MITIYWESMPTSVLWMIIRYLIVGGETPKWNSNILVRILGDMSKLSKLKWTFHNFSSKEALWYTQYLLLKVSILS